MDSLYLSIDAHRLRTVVGPLLALALASAAQAGDKPPVPVAPAPGGVRVALVDSGVDYTQPVIAAALARRADGTPLGIDFRDLDARPFDRVPGPPTREGGPRRHGTAVASVLLREAPDVALVPYRYPGQDMRLMHALVTHAAAVGVRVMGLPLGSDDPSQWQAFQAAADAHPDMLFVASAGNDGRNLDKRPLYPASLPLDNLVTVTSADDFGRASPESGIGRGAVDWLVPAEAVPVIGFSGVADVKAGASYAVPKLVARYAREFARTPDAGAAAIIARVRSAHANGAQPRSVGQGVMIDPLADTVEPLSSVPVGVLADITRPEPGAADDTVPPLQIPLDVFALDASWSDEALGRTLSAAATLLAPCSVRLVPQRIDRPELDGHDRLRDLHVGSAHTLFERLGRSGAAPRVAVVFARDSAMQVAFEAEAFGLGNTRDRAWMRHSVWLTESLVLRPDDAAIALAHELWHVLANSGAHHPDADHLMAATTSGDNHRLDPADCDAAREGARRQQLATME